MTVGELMDKNLFQVVNQGENPECEIGTVYCCDLLSVAMGKAPKDCAWVTVMANMNTLAVASLAEAACVVLAEGAELDDQAVKKASDQGITVFQTELPVFEAALSIHDCL